MKVIPESDSERPMVDSSPRRRWRAVVPYIAIAIFMWLTAEALLRWTPPEGRVWSLLWSWGYTQALIIGECLATLEHFHLVTNNVPVAHSVWLGAYLVAGAVAGMLVEVRGWRLARRSWQRALITWGAIILLYSLIAALLVGFGYLRD